MPKNDEIIIITAARPGLWAKERLTPSAIKRWLGEKFYKDYGKTMKKLRQIDDAIYEWVKDIEVLNKQLKEKRKSPGPMTDKKVIDIAILLGSINKRFKKINHAGDILEDMNEKYLENFEDQYTLEVPDNGEIYELDSGEREEIEMLREDEDEDEAEDGSDDIFATAGFWNDLKQKWVSRKLERDDEKKRRKEINSISQKAEKMVRSLKKYLKNLSKARAAGDVGQYLDTINIISQKQQSFENDFSEVYNNYVRGPVEKMLEEQAPATIQDSPNTEDMTEQIPSTIPGEPTIPESIEVELPEIPSLDLPIKHMKRPESDPIPSTYPADYPSVYPSTKDQFKWPSTRRKVPVLDEETPSTQPASQQNLPSIEFEGISPEEMDIPPTLRSQRTALEAKLFLEGIKKISNPYEKAALIAKYSERFEDTNSDKSIKLLTIAENIIRNAKR